MLAAKIVQNLDFNVLGLHYVFRFDPMIFQSIELSLKKLFKPVGIEIKVVDLTELFLPRFLNPDHGYGSEINPCIDCRILMLQQAKKIMEGKKSDFIITGEVVGQRPMTQKKPMMFHIEKVTALQGRILRPLSAKLLPPTLAEQEGKIDRSQLYEITGRSRKEQIALAAGLGITQYPQPAGGCILTDPQYANRVRVLFKHKKKDNIFIEDLQLLRLGRHFWPHNKLHVIVGRNKMDNQYLNGYKKDRWVFRPGMGEGPLVLAEGIYGEKDLRIVANILTRYCKKHALGQFPVLYYGFGKKGTILVENINEKLIDNWRI